MIGKTYLGKCWNCKEGIIVCTIILTYTNETKAYSYCYKCKKRIIPLLEEGNYTYKVIDAWNVS